MPNRIEHKIENGVELKRCGKCRTYKPLNEFHKVNNTWDRLFYCCINCYNSNRSGANPGHAEDRYRSLCWRVANDEKYIRRGTQVKISRKDFVKWYQKHYFKGCHVDRIDNNGHYELSNMQLIPQREHNFKRRNDRLEIAGIIEPNGMRYCFECKTLKSESNFYRKKRKMSENNPKGLDECCKECSRNKRMDYYHKDKGVNS